MNNYKELRSGGSYSVIFRPQVLVPKRGRKVYPVMTPLEREEEKLRAKYPDRGPNYMEELMELWARYPEDEAEAELLACRLPTRPKK